MTDKVYVMLEIDHGARTIHDIYEDEEYAKELALKYSALDSRTRVVYGYNVVRRPKVTVTREDVIAAAIKTISKMPAHQLAELKRNFEQAEAEAEQIVKHPGSRQ